MKAEIVLEPQLFTRQQILMAFGEAYCYPPNTNKEVDVDLASTMCDILFGIKK